MVKEVFIAHMLQGRGGGLISYPELCAAPSDIHISQPRNGRKNNRRCYFCLCRFLPPVSVFLLLLSRVTRFNGVTCGRVSDTSSSYPLMWVCVTVYLLQTIVLHF